MSLRKSSSKRNGSKSEVLPKPKARRKCTPAPSKVGLASLSRRMGRIDMFAFQLRVTVSLFNAASNRNGVSTLKGGLIGVKLRNCGMLGPRGPLFGQHALNRNDQLA